jgi:hypothetical protein
VDIAPTLAPFLRVAMPDVDGRCIDLGQGCPSTIAQSGDGGPGR